MIPRCLILFIAVWFGPGLAASAQISPATGRDMSGGTLKISADEVSLTFHADDTHGMPVNDLKAGEIRIIDNGKPAARVLAFYSMMDGPIRAALLFDTSESMFRDLAANRAIALEAVREIPHAGDLAAVLDFGYTSNLRQDWTGDPHLLANAIGAISPGDANPLPGTALFDAVYRTCFYSFGRIDHVASGNFILLFSDGEDNAGHEMLAQAVGACQRANTAVYVFRPPDVFGQYSTGPRNLNELAEQTGGRVFRSNGPPEEIADDLRTVDADLRNQYQLVYKPTELKHDGAFHEIGLLGPDRVARIHVRSGYYAPAH